jgi:hypothetical protein
MSDEQRRRSRLPATARTHERNLRGFSHPQR